MKQFIARIFVLLLLCGCESQEQDADAIDPRFSIAPMRDVIRESLTKEREIYLSSLSLQDNDGSLNYPALTSDFVAFVDHIYNDSRTEEYEKIYAKVVSDPILNELDNITWRSCHWVLVKAEKDLANKPSPENCKNYKVARIQAIQLYLSNPNQHQMIIELDIIRSSQRVSQYSDFCGFEFSAY